MKCTHPDRYLSVAVLESYTRSDKECLTVNVTCSRCQCQFTGEVVRLRPVLETGSRLTPPLRRPTMSLLALTGAVVIVFGIDILRVILAMLDASYDQLNNLWNNFK